MPSFFTPLVPASSETCTPLYARSATWRWHRASRWVPSCIVADTCSVIQFTSLSPTGIAAFWWCAVVTSVCLKKRPGKTGMASSTWLSIPSWSSAPKGDGHQRVSRDGAEVTRTTRASRSSGRAQPTVDEERLAGDVGGVVACEEGGHAGHLVGVPGALHRDVLLHLLALLGIVDPGAVDRGDRRAGAHAIHADAPGCVLERQRPGEVLHPALAGRVAEVARLRDQLVDARDVDDHARLLLRQEVPDGLAGAHERAAQVHGEHLVEVLARELLGGPGDLDAGVVDEHVDAAEAVDRLADHLHDVVLLGHVAPDEYVLDALLVDFVDAGVHLVLGLLGLLGLAEVVDRHVGAVLGEAHRDRLPDPGAAPGHEHVLVVEASEALGSLGGRACLCHWSSSYLG